MESTDRLTLDDAESASDDDDEDEEENDEDLVASKEKSINYAAISSKLTKKAPALLASARDPANETLLHAAELEAESRGISATQFENELAGEIKKNKKLVKSKESGPKKVDRSREEQLASIMLTGKQKKLYNKMSYSRDRKLEEVRLSFLSFSPARESS